MDSLQNYVDERVAELVQRGEVVDVYAEAQKIHAAYPDHKVAYVARLVSASVVRHRGNAEWLEAAG